MEAMSEEVKEWVVDWFVANSSAPREEVEADTGADYLEEAWIDSIQFITLISEAEEEFDIEFENDEFQNRQFATVDGLSSIIEGKVRSEG